MNNLNNLNNPLTHWPSPSSPYSPSDRKSFEMRSETWHSPVPRILKVCKAGYSTIEIGKFITLKYRCIDAHTVPTPLLHVSQEARQAALRRYQLPFNGLIKGDPIYLDYERDSLLFMNYLALQRPLLKKLVIEIPDLNVAVIEFRAYQRNDLYYTATRESSEGETPDRRW